MEGNGDTPPFWAQSNHSIHHTRRRSSSPLFSNSAFLIVVLPLSALFFIFLIIPFLLSFTSQIFRPNQIKKSWDSVNFMLVLIAIICGILCRRNDDSNPNTDEQIAVTNRTETEKSNPPSTPIQWFQFPDQRIYNNVEKSDSTVGGRLRRNSSSYPDLRQESLLASGEDKWRFFDDSEVNSYRSRSDYVPRHRRQWQSTGEEDTVIKTIPVDTFSSRPSQSPLSPPLSSQKPPSQPPPPPPAPPPHRRSPPAINQKTRRNFQTIAQQEKTEKPEIGDLNVEKVPLSHSSPPSSSPAPASVPPPAPPPPPLRPVAGSNRSSNQYSETERSGKKRRGGTKDIASALASIYQRKKKKKQKNVDPDYDYDTHHYRPSNPSQSIPAPPPPPPPPPPPAPSSVFHNLFFNKKSYKNKKIHSVSAQPPPPPPPPPPAPVPATSSSRSSKRKTQVAPSSPLSTDSHRQKTPITSGRPPLPTMATKTKSFEYPDENVSHTGCESPLIPIPPPPPPPFKMKDLKFIIRGDFVRLKSINSSRSSSPDLDSIDISSNKEESRTSTTSMNSEDVGESLFFPSPDVNGGNMGGSSVFCPSPDVNTKADSFIARFKAGLELEKINSFKEKQAMGISAASGSGKGPSQA